VISGFGYDEPLGLAAHSDLDTLVAVMQGNPIGDHLASGGLHGSLVPLCGRWGGNRSAQPTLVFSFLFFWCSLYEAPDIGWKGEVECERCPARFAGRLGNCSTLDMEKQLDWEEK